MATILQFGDIFGKPGRKALARILPEYIAEIKPDLIIANVENLAHGKGVTTNTLEELRQLGIEVFTSGNHIFDKKEYIETCFEQFPMLIRPINYSASLPGQGYYRIHKNEEKFLIINLGGKVFFDNLISELQITNPFFAIDKIIEEQSQKDDIIIVDFHAEATSEKMALGVYLDGRVTALTGTHTHVPTADERILPKETAFISDIGFTGPRDSVIGVASEKALNMFLEKDKFKMEVADSSEVVVNAVVITTNGPKAVSIERKQKIFNL